MTKSAGTFWDCRESADSLPSDLLLRMAVRPLIAASPRPAATDSSGSLLPTGRRGLQFAGCVPAAAKPLPRAAFRSP